MARRASRPGAQRGADDGRAPDRQDEPRRRPSGPSSAGDTSGDPDIEQEQEPEPVAPVGDGGDEDGEPDFLDGGDDDGKEQERSLPVVAAPAERAVVPSDPLARYIQQVRRFRELDREEEQELARRYVETGDAEAAAQLITANLMLVVKLALMYRRALRNVMDLIQEGNVGLMEALKRYDPEQGVRFHTYAAWWIKAYMLKFLMDNARLVRVGTTNARRKLLYNLRKEQRKLEEQGIRPTPRLLADRFGVSEDDVKEVDRALASPDLSVDAPLTEEGSFTVADVLPTGGPSAEQAVMETDLREQINRVVGRFREDLDERERAILDQRLLAEEPTTLQQLGEQFGVTREAMRQSEVKLKTRLGRYLRENLGEEVILHFSAGE
jgi:RNA polymerase sigma-32 factor